MRWVCALMLVLATGCSDGKPAAPPTAGIHLVSDTCVGDPDLARELGVTVDGVKVEVDVLADPLEVTISTETASAERTAQELLDKDLIHPCAMAARTRFAARGTRAMVLDSVVDREGMIRFATQDFWTPGDETLRVIGEVLLTDGSRTGTGLWAVSGLGIHLFLPPVGSPYLDA